MSVSVVSAKRSRDNNFTLVTKDAVDILVDSNLLSVHSTMFKDLLYRPQSNKDQDGDQDQNGRCEIAEKAADIKLVLAILNGDERKFYTIPELSMLVKLGDKYDLAIVNLTVKSYLWYVFSIVVSHVRVLKKRRPPASHYRCDARQLHRTLRPSDATRG